jgi:iron complex transport system ATP-binding protein
VSKRSCTRAGRSSIHVDRVRTDRTGRTQEIGRIGTAVELREVSVRLGKQVVLTDVTVTVGRAEWLGLIGPNGAGKTTLLRAVNGLVPYSGVILLQGRSVASSRRRELARRVALLPQTPQTPPELTVSEYVLLGRTPYIGYLSSEGRADHAAAARALERLGLRRFAGRLLASLSGGELQRVVLARALAQEAQILLLDEPTSALDLGRQQQVLELVDELRRETGLTVISAMHDLTLAGQYADRVLLLDAGRAVAEGAAGEVLSAARVAAHYGADVRVIEEEGGVFVLPRRRVRG